MDEDAKTGERVTTGTAGMPRDKRVESIGASVGTPMVAVDKLPVSATVALVLSPTPTPTTQGGSPNTLDAKT